jgi:recombination protein RecA
MAKSKNKKPRQSFSLAREIINKVNTSNKSRGGALLYDLGAKENSKMGVPKWYVSTGDTALDMAMTNTTQGGIPGGYIVEMFGLKQSGKTLLSLTIAREAQDAGGFVVYFDTEQRFFRPFAEALGVDLDERFIYADSPNLEDVLHTIHIINKQYHEANRGSKNIKPLIFIIDSLHATGTLENMQSEDYELGGYQTHKARILSQHLPKLNYEISKSGATLIILNQLRTNIGAVMGEKYVTTGGMTPQYYASLRLYLKSKTIYKESGQEIGRNITAKVVKNSLNRPNLEANFVIRYDSGINKYLGWYDVLESNKLIKKAGAWSRVELPDTKTGEMTEHSFYKKDFEQTVETVPGAREYLESKVLEYLKFEYKKQNLKNIKDNQDEEE